jgi:hypothetical protein
MDNALRDRLTTLQRPRSSKRSEEPVPQGKSLLRLKAGGRIWDSPPGGRPRKHANVAERVRDHRKRKKCNETSFVTQDGPACNETSLCPVAVGGGRADRARRGG